MKRVGKTALIVAVIGVIAPMGPGMGVMKLLHPSSALASDLFIGGILTATSVGITARVLRDLHQENRDESKVIFGAAVIDDVLTLVVLAVVGGLAVTGSGDSRKAGQRFRMSSFHEPLGRRNRHDPARGEVGLIFAGIGKNICAIDDGLFSAIVILMMITTLLSPMLLRATLGQGTLAGLR